MWHFLQPPSDFKSLFENYDTTRNDWNSDVHLIGTYIFLGQDERRVFAEQNHHILINNHSNMSIYRAQVLKY